MQGEGRKAGMTQIKTVEQVQYGTGSGAASMQKCSWLYLQRRHDIPCPLKLATERCSPRSCCRCPSQANTSTAKRRRAENPIGLTGSVPSSGKWRHCQKTLRGSESGNRKESQSGGVEQSSRRQR